MAADAGPRPDPPAGVPADWWSQVQRSIQLEEYAVVAEGAAGTDFRAVNPAHRFEGRFDAGGLRLAPTEGADWEWGLSFTGWGRPGALHAADVSWLYADEDRVELDRGSLTEWFVNAPAGLEHGFTVPFPPRDAGNRLVFDLALASGLRPLFAEDGQAIDFFSAGNVSVLRYAKLVVTDAAGAVLAARMEPIAGGIRIVVDDSRAIYPITVDPLATSPSWTAAGEATGDSFGWSVATAGDVNGDGYSDVVVGAYGHTSYTGKAYLYLGGASGLSASASWTAAGEAANNCFGWSVATAGDVNGDGYSDVIVGAYGHTTSTGKAYLYFGGGGTGVSLMPRQLRAELSAPISLGGPAFEQQFRLGLTLCSPVGRVARKPQWQVVPWGGSFAPAINPITSDSTWYSTPAAFLTLVSLPADLQRYVWRARVKYHPAQSPFVPWSPWFTLSGNALHEADLFSTSQAPPPPCVVPDEELYITTVTIDGNGKPVLHYQDPNQPADVTGYNVYRAAAPTGPWVLIGSNVVDMDEGTPDKQYVDQTGDVGGPWFYEIAAWNDACGAEGPY